MLPTLSVPRLHQHHVHVWRISLCASDELLHSLEQLLAADERARAARFHFTDDRRRYVVARGWLRLLLAPYLQELNPAALTFTTGPHGKPQLPHADYHFNLSHSGNRALVAVSRTIVGIDLEQLRPLDYDAIARDVFNPAELAQMADAPLQQKMQTFFRTWVRREARLKALGLAIGHQPPAIPVHDLSVGSDACAAVATPLENPRIQILGA